ncbi:hypothetical protein [Moorena sp. SIO3A2]|uniref:hypothetical protein n=1 Tax=Moorena sp. SIO3A2 TaxID=2607841 RepID=UPI0013BA4FB8|nr:hypothetical protein [Moorena sp. SIO3A2]NER90323.1 hypothetical protein [Moorena sp. SIO3A2]
MIQTKGTPLDVTAERFADGIVAADNKSLRHLVPLLRGKSIRKRKLAIIYFDLPLIELIGCLQEDTAMAPQSALIAAEEIRQAIYKLVSRTSEMINSPQKLQQTEQELSTAYFHPLTGEPTRGADKDGIDWLDRIGSETHRAALWVLKNDPTLHPGTGITGAISLITNDDACRLMMSRYFDAIANWDKEGYSTDPGLTNVLVMDEVVDAIFPKEEETETPVVEAVPVTGWPEFSEEGAELKLKSSSDICNICGSDHKITPGIYSNVNVQGSDNKLRNLIVLEAVNIRGRDNSGHLFLAPRCKLNIKGSGNGIKITRLPDWAAVLKKRKELEI